MAQAFAIVGVIIATAAVLTVGAAVVLQPSSAGTDTVINMTGATGVRGPMGFTGPTSLAPIGETGPTGATGPVVTVSSTGPTGSGGDTGITGPASSLQGPQGATGMTGTAAGPRGPTGSTGVTGPSVQYATGTGTLILMLGSTEIATGRVSTVEGPTASAFGPGPAGVFITGDVAWTVPLSLDAAPPEMTDPLTLRAQFNHTSTSLWPVNVSVSFVESSVSQYMIVASAQPNVVSLWLTSNTAPASIIPLQGVHIAEPGFRILPSNHIFITGYFPSA